MEILSKMLKDRKESIKAFVDNGRAELAEDEQKESDIITSYLPKQATEEEIKQAIEEVIAKLSATSIRDMGKVMGELKTIFMGKADLLQLGDLVKKRLSAAAPPK
jgi:uncharacterized protein YqeY